MSIKQALEAANLAVQAYPERYTCTPETPLLLRYGIDRISPRVAEAGPAPTVSATTCRIYDARGKTLSREVGVEPAAALDVSLCRSFCGAGAEYPNLLTVDLADFEPGPYFAVLSDEEEVLSHPAYFVVRPPQPDARVLLVHPTFTWQAYNQVGGQSFYWPTGYDLSSPRAVSLDRPFSIVALAPHHQPWAGVKFDVALADSGIAYTSTDSFDVHENPWLVEQHDVVVLCTHDEYMSREIRDAYEAFVQAGGNIAVFSGNTGWYKVDVDEREISITYGVDDDWDHGPRTRPLQLRGDVAGRWDHPSIGRPPEELFGLTYTHGGIPLDRARDPDRVSAAVGERVWNERNAVEIADASHPIFAGLGLRNGDLVGHAEHLWDYEVDGLPLTEDGEIDRALVPEAPERIQVLGYAWVEAYRGGAPVKTAGIVEAQPDEADGTVIHLGSIGWYRSVATSGSAQHAIFRNTLEHLLADG